MTPEVRVSVVIPCRNEAPYIAALLQAIADQDYRVSEAIVVDAASTDGTLAEIAGFRSRTPSLTVVVVEGPIGAIPVSLNLGISRATGDVIVRFDAHSIPQRDYVGRAVARLRDPRTGVVGGLWTIESGGPSRIARAIAVAVGHPLAAGDAAYRIAGRGTGVREVESAPFGCYRRELWEQLGGYSEDLQVAEDYEFNHRVRAMGYAVVLDTAMASTYFARSSLTALAVQYFRYGWWKAEVIRRFPDSWRWRAFVPATFVAVTFALVAASAWIPAVRLLLALLLGTYAGALLAGSIHAAAGPRVWSLIPVLPAVFATVHACQGAGVLANLLGANWPRRAATGGRRR